MKPSLLFSFSLLSFTLISCQERQINSLNDNNYENIHINVQRSKLFDNYTPQKIEVADFVADYFNLMFDSTLEQRNAHWDSKILTYEQDFFLGGGFDKKFFYHYAPKILGIRELENKTFQVKLEIEQNGFTFKIMNLVVAFDGLERPYFIDQLGENLETFDTIKNENLTFLYSPKVTKNDSLEQQMVDFNQKLADLFQTQPKHTSIIVLKDLKDYSEVLGYDYITLLTYDGQTGGIAMPEERILFSANNSPYYPHELVHLYTADQNAHYWFDEGCATYLGGSVEFPLDHHIKKLADLTDTLDFSEIPKDKKIDDDTSFKYTLGGLFCKLAMEKYGGKESLFKLLNSGKTEEDFHAAVKEVFNLERKNYDQFIKEKLKPYNMY